MLPIGSALAIDRDILVAVAYIIAVCNLKGGTGKTTLCVNLAAQLTSRGTCTLVDADVQASAVRYAASGLLPVDVVPLPLDGERAVERWVKQVLAVGTDYVVLDLPPHANATTKAAISIADTVLVPCGASPVDLNATVGTVQLVRTARSERDDNGPKCLLVPSRVDTRTVAGRELASVLKKFNEGIGPAIRQRQAFIDAAVAGKWVGDVERGDALEDINSVMKAVLRHAKTTIKTQ